MATTGDLNIDNAGLSQAAAAAPAEVTPVPKPKKKNNHCRYAQ